MASLAGHCGTGTTLTLSVSSWDSDVKIRSLSLSGVSRGATDTSHMSTTLTTSGGFGSRTYTPHRLVDPGELTVEFLHNPDFYAPVDDIPTSLAALETVTITYLGPDSAAGATWVADAFCTSMDVDIPWDGDEMVGTATFKLSGKVTVTVDA